MIKDLKKVFMPKWRVQRVYNKFDKEQNKDVPLAACVAFFNKETAAEMLDRAVGHTNWQKKFQSLPMGNNKFLITCQVGLLSDNSDTWIWREDAGESFEEGDDERSMMTSAFKRACGSWGVGWFFNELGQVQVKVNMSKDEAKKKNQTPMPIDENGRIIWDLSTYVNEMPLIKKKLKTLGIEEPSQISNDDSTRKRLSEVVVSLALKMLSEIETLDELKQTREIFKVLEDEKHEGYKTALTETHRRVTKKCS
jgi:hypothetical protein